MNDLQLVKKNEGIKEYARLIYLTNECKATYTNISEQSSTWQVINFAKEMKNLIS